MSIYLDMDDIELSMSFVFLISSRTTKKKIEGTIIDQNQIDRNIIGRNNLISDFCQKKKKKKSKY